MSTTCTITRQSNPGLDLTYEMDFDDANRIIIAVADEVTSVKLVIDREARSVVVFDPEGNIKLTKTATESEISTAEPPAPAHVENLASFDPEDPSYKADEHRTDAVIAEDETRPGLVRVDYNSPTN